MRRVLAGIVFGLLAYAQAPDFAIEGRVVYSASFPLGRWEGSNNSVKGSVQWDTKTGAASGKVCIDMGKFDSGIGLRDDDARSVLETSKFPQACLEASRLVWDEAAKTGVLEGTLDFRNLKKALKINGQLQRDGNAYRFVGSFKTSFSEWKMDQPSRLFLTVDNPIDVRLEAKAVPR